MLYPKPNCYIVAGAAAAGTFQKLSGPKGYHTENASIVW